MKYAFSLLVGGLTLFAGISFTANAYTQAPNLENAALKVLPPVKKRLPENPLVIKVVQQNGVYGGTLRSVIRKGFDQNGILRMVGNQGLTHWSQDGSKVDPYVAESYSVSADASEYIFKLRQGMRWSNGMPFTADDILFAMNDLLGNKEFSSRTPEIYMINGEPPEVTKLDDYTVKFKFSGSYLEFPKVLAAPYGQHPVFYAKHHCQRFHPKYNKNLDELFVRYHVRNWPDLMRSRCADIEMPSRWGRVERPTLDPWIVKEPYDSVAERVILERNPYFWQVDSKGQQLPYIDEMALTVAYDDHSALTSAITGGYDFEGRMFTEPAYRETLLKNQRTGGYKVFGQVSTNANSAGLWLNQTTKNGKLLPFITKLEFRQALSLALDRTQINQKAFYGLGSPWQTGPFKSNKWYNEKLATQLIKHQPDEANKLLDQLGLTARDTAGYRQYPSGGRVTLKAIVIKGRPNMIAALELVRDQWRQVGIDLSIVASERQQDTSLALNNDYDVSVDAVPGGLDATLSPRAYVANHPIDSRQSLDWAKWYLSKGKQGSEPSPSMKKRMVLYDEWRAAKNDVEADKLFSEILKIAAEELEVIGTVRPPPVTSIRNLKLKNVNEKAPFSWPLGSPSLTLPQQWYFVK